jgi:hypothetical protein
MPWGHEPAVSNARRFNREAQNEQRGRAVRFVCECAKVECGEFVSCSLGDYMRVRSWGSRFLVVAGHEDLDLERVVERHETWPWSTRGTCPTPLERCS